MSSAIPIAVNFHLWKPCNLKCRFCFAVFDDVPGRLSVDEARRLVAVLAEAGCDKLTFVGGEPTLCPYLGELLGVAKAANLTTCIVSNGARLQTLVESQTADIDWVGLSVDSASEETQARLGRGAGHHVRKSVDLADLIRARGIRLKLNTVVTALNHSEDMSDFVRRVRPERWKIFQMLRIEGQNDGADDLLVTRAQFDAFILRHADLGAEALAPVAEDNEAMTGSYVMIDPLGRFFDNVDGRHLYSPPILEVGVERALAEIRWQREKFVARGGLYPWRRR
ncbi:MAG TPA: viperin family antiviral radical SAM protein [Kofleriaceae bacterium]|jgi:radical S-adenosyl methionine domain-containing protein 2